MIQGNWLPTENGVLHCSTCGELFSHPHIWDSEGSDIFKEPTCMRCVRLSKEFDDLFSSISDESNHSEYESCV